MPTTTQVIPSMEARASLSSYLEDFRSNGVSAETVVFGSHRKAEGVIMSYARYSQMIEFLDDLVISEEVAEAFANDGGGRTSAADVAREAGLDPAEFGL